MYAQDALDNPPFRPGDQTLVRHPHRVQLCIDLLVPIAQEATQFGEVRCYIVILPDIELQQRRVIWQAVVTPVVSP
jgi:hypothetical protein